MNRPSHHVRTMLIRVVARRREKGRQMMNKPKFAKKSLFLAASLLLLAALLPATIAASEGPAVIATISLGANPEATAFALAVNPNTNKTYVTPGAETLDCESH